MNRFFKAFVITGCLMALCIISNAQGRAENSSSALYEGLYTATGKSYDYVNQHFMDTGVTALHQVKIYRDRIIIDDSETPYSKTDGDFLCYGNVDGEPKYLFNPKTFDLRWRFTFVFFGMKQVSDNFWVVGDQQTAHLGGGSSGNNTQGNAGSYGNGSSNTTSGGQRCSICSGSGKCEWPTSVSYSKYYCRGSGICANCNGKGRVSVREFSQETIDCSFCTNGKCGYCGGSGRCHACSGTGRK